MDNFARLRANHEENKKALEAAMAAAEEAVKKSERATKEAAIAAAFLPSTYKEPSIKPSGIWSPPIISPAHGAFITAHTPPGSYLPTLAADVKRTRSVFLYKDTEFWILQNGHIECGEDRAYWCEHISTALSVNADAEGLWIDIASALLNEQEFYLDIPMIPTASQWGRVKLVSAENFKTPVYKVFYVGSAENQDEFIGFIHPGEGRIVIRSMIFDWFRSTVVTNSLVCKSSSHKYAAQMRWEKDMKNPRMKAAQHWSVWSTVPHMCLICASHNDSQFDDLVPEMDKKESIF